MADKPKKFESYYLDPGEYSLWDRFVSDSSNSTLFHTSQWAKVVANTFERPCKILTLKTDEEILAGIMFFPKQSLGIRSITQITATTYQGILHKPLSTEKASSSRAQLHEFTKIIVQGLKNDYDYIEIPIPPGTDDVRPYLWEGFTAEPQYTYRFDIKPYDDLSKDFSQALRRKINVSLKQENRVSTSRDIEPLADFVIDSYRHHQMAPPLTREQILAMLNSCLELEIGTLFYLYFGQEPIAGLFVLHDNNYVYALFSGIHSHFRNQSYTEYLHAVALQIPDFLGKKFDFLGANTPQFEQFKRSFGGSLVPYFRIRYVKNRFIEQASHIRHLQHHLARYRPGKNR